MTQRPAPGPSFAELFTPKLLTVLREGYSAADLRADCIAGLTVAIVALPLSMAIAIASGASPAQGLYTAIFGGFVVSALGGSRFQIGGPAGAFIVLVATTVQQHGIDGLVLATILSGFILLAIGFFQLGTYIKFIPYPVTIGFTAGIAVIIVASQLKDLLGLTLVAPEPGPLLAKISVLWRSLGSFDPLTLALALGTVMVISALKYWRPHWPGLLIAVALGALLVALFDLPVKTIGTAFGGIPSSIPLPRWPAWTLADIWTLLPVAFSFALLGSIESLLSAVVADGMTGRRHRSNCELVGQGVANIVSGLFGGFCVTGTIARTATNVRAGAHGPVAGMVHALCLLLFIVLAAPLAGHIPLASLAGLLAIVAWNMIERQAIMALIKADRGEALVLITTFLLTIFRDLTEAIVVGFALGSVLFIYRMSNAAAVERHSPFVAEDRADGRNDGADGHSAPALIDGLDDVVVYRITGAFFFGAAASIGSVLERIADTHRALVIDLGAVPFVDSTAARTLQSIANKAVRRQVAVVLTGCSASMRRELSAHRIRPPLVTFAPTIADAIVILRHHEGGVANDPL